MKNIKRIVALILCLFLVSATSTVVFATETTEAKEKYPFVLVHGMMGWGENSTTNNKSAYFGMRSEKPMADFFREKGYEVAIPTVAPLGSAWDRACEVFAQITGTRVDYGKAHSEACRHERFGRDYTGQALLSDNGWDLNTPINLVGHSFGGPTCYVLTSMLEHGVEDEINASPDDCSELFKGGHKGLVYSMTALESPHNGSPVANLLNDGFVTLLAAATFMNIIGTLNNPPLDFMVDQFGITKDPSKGETAKLTPKACWALATSRDHSGYDMSLKGAKELYSKFHISESTYYFSCPVNGTKVNSLGMTIPYKMNLKNPMVLTSVLPVLLSKIPINGKIPGKEWKANDGLVPVISAHHPFDQPFADYDENVELDKGVWYVLPVVQGGNHGYAIAGDAEKMERICNEIMNRVENI